MIIIGHRGATGLAPENTIESLEAGLSAGSDILEFDVRLTRDRVPVLIHDARLTRTHNQAAQVSSLNYSQLRELTGDSSLPTLDQVLNRFFTKTLLNIELKSRGSGQVVIDRLAKLAGNDQAKWDSLLISSFHVSELRLIRKRQPLANLALLHDHNPFRFIAHQRHLDLSAVGFNYLHTNNLALEVAKKSGLFSYAYTIDDPETAINFARIGFDGIVTNHPDRIAAQLQQLSQLDS